MDEKYIDFKRTEKSSEHVEQIKQNINFSEVKILNKEENYCKCMMKEAIEAEKYPYNFNREDRWKISNTRRPVIH